MELILVQSQLFLPEHTFWQFHLMSLAWCSERWWTTILCSHALSHPNQWIALPLSAVLTSPCSVCCFLYGVTNFGRPCCLYLIYLSTLLYPEDQHKDQHIVLKMQGNHKFVQWQNNDFRFFSTPTLTFYLLFQQLLCWHF